MHQLQKAGGIAALFEAVAYVIGFAVSFTVLSPGDGAVLSQSDKLAFLLGKQHIVQGLNVLIYVLFGAMLVVLACALHARLATKSPALLPVATSFALIWAGLVIASGMIANVGLEFVAPLFARDPQQAATVWLAIATVQNGVGGGVELVGGLWVLLISYAAWQSGALPRGLNGLGMLVGAAGVVTLVPGLSDVGAVFGLGQILWFIWLGVVLLRSP